MLVVEKIPRLFLKTWLVLAFGVSILLFMHDAKSTPENPTKNDVVNYACNEGASNVFVENDLRSQGCFCDAGFEQIGSGTFSDGKPNQICDLRDTDDDVKDPITDPGDDIKPKPGSSPDGDEELTLAKCVDLKNQCVERSTSITEDCLAVASQRFGRELGFGRPCFGQSVEDLMDGFQWRQFGLLPVDCHASDLLDFSNFDSLNCRTQYMKRGMDRCMGGVKKSAVNKTVSRTESDSLDVGTYSGGESNTVTLQTSEESQAGIGARWRCGALGTRASSACADALTKCKDKVLGRSPPTLMTQPISSEQPSAVMIPPLAAAERPPSVGTATPSAARLPSRIGIAPPAVAERPPALVIVPPAAAELPSSFELAPTTPAEGYIERIDKVLLGFQDPFTRVSTSPFRSLSQGPLEADRLYLTRLKFLAKWSGFLKQESVSDAAKVDMHKAFSSVQAKYTKPWDSYLILLKRVWTLDVETGEPGSDESREHLEAFNRSGGITKAFRHADEGLRVKVEQILGSVRAKSFFDNVWPGSVGFGFSTPMSNNQALFSERNGGDVVEEPVFQ